jgi:NADH-quinone oxidoreductase subunit H
MPEWMQYFWPDWFQYIVSNLLLALVILLPLFIVVAYYTLAERKVIGFMQVRIGPNRVGPKGLLQPFADMFKLMFKEIIVPTNSNKYLFFIAPVITFAPAMAAWAVVPFSDTLVFADICTARRNAFRGTDCGLRNRDGIRAGWRINGGWQPESG